MTEKITIVVPTWNHLNDLLKPCIESIQKHTKLENDVELLIIPNGCTEPGYREYLDSISGSNIRYKWFDEALGFTKAINEGIKISTGDYVVICNNDITVYDDHWLELLSQKFKEDPQMGIVGAMNLPYFELGIYFNVMFCTMVKKSLFDELGLLDEVFSPGYGEDINFTIKAIRKGYHQYSYMIGWNMETHRREGIFPVNHVGEGTMHDKDWEKKVLQDHFKEGKWDDHTQKCRDILKERYQRHINIVTPTYNRIDSLMRMLLSVAKQTYPHATVHVCADGHDEKVEALVNDFNTKSPRIKAKYYSIEHEGNWGSKPRIHILEQLPDDELVCFVDDDNEIHPEYCSKMNLMVEDKNSMAMCHIYHKEAKRIMPGTWMIAFENLDALNVMMWTNVAKKNKMKWMQDPTQKVNHDWNFLYACSQGMKTRMLNEVLGSHGQLPQNAVKLNLACGEQYMGGYINIDLYNEKADVKMDVAKLDYPDNHADEIIASHILEHFHFHDSFKVLKEWLRVLKPGGKIIIETPDLMGTCRRFVEGGDDLRIKLYAHMFSMPWFPGHTHLFLYTEQQLTYHLHEAGFKNIRRIEPFSHDAKENTAIQDTYLAMEAEK